MSGTTIAIIVLSVILLAILLVWAINKSIGKEYFGDAYSSEAKNLKFKEKYMNDAEFYFYNFVKDHLDKQYFILPKVGVDNLVEPINNNLNQYNTVKSKYLDFVIFDSSNQKPLFVIDLVEHGVGSTNPYFDKDVSKALDMVNIKIFTKTVERYYVWDVLKQELEKYLQNEEDKKLEENVKPQETENK